MTSTRVVQWVLMRLTPRESEVLRLVAEGMANKQIANDLGISHQTVKNHMTAVLDKLEVDDRTGAAVAYVRGDPRIRYGDDQDIPSLDANLPDWLELRAEEWERGVVYFVQEDRSAAIKIGTSRALLGRLKNIQSCNPNRIKLLGIAKGGTKLEGKLHSAFTEHRIHGEWFEPAEEIVDWIDKNSEKKWYKAAKDYQRYFV